MLILRPQEERQWRSDSTLTAILAISDLVETLTAEALGPENQEADHLAKRGEVFLEVRGDCYHS